MRVMLKGKAYNWASVPPTKATPKLVATMKLKSIMTL